MRLQNAHIWLARYKRDGCAASNLRFLLFTTGRVPTGSFLARLIPDQPIASGDAATLIELANAALAKSKSKLITPIAATFNELSDPDALVEEPWAKPPALVPEDWPHEQAT